MQINKIIYSYAFFKTATNLQHFWFKLSYYI